MSSSSNFRAACRHSSAHFSHADLLAPLLTALFKPFCAAFSHPQRLPFLLVFDQQYHVFHPQRHFSRGPAGLRHRGERFGPRRAFDDPAAGLRQPLRIGDLRQHRRGALRAGPVDLRHPGEQFGLCPALDDPVADLRQPLRIGDLRQHRRQASGVVVELPHRLPAQQCAFLGAALFEPLGAALLEPLRAAFRHPLRRPLLHVLGQHRLHLLQPRQRLRCRQSGDDSPRATRAGRPRGTMPAMLSVALADWRVAPRSRGGTSCLRRCRRPSQSRGLLAVFRRCPATGISAPRRSRRHRAGRATARFNAIVQTAGVAASPSTAVSGTSAQR